MCASTPTGDLEPYSSEYEGYMGNYGNTLDRWYHRAAVIVWPGDRAFANRAETSGRSARRPYPVVIGTFPEAVLRRPRYL